MSRKLTKEEFVEKSKVVHKDKYTYENFKYINTRTKSTITCEKHGDFEQTPNSHLSGYGCPKCAIEYRADLKRSNSEEFIQKAKKVHDSFYDYSIVDYANSRKKVTIICPIHGEFEQSPSDHLRGNGCPKCAGTYKSNLQEFIEKVKIVHKNSKNKYSYDKFVYKGSKIKGTITCEKHGDFEQRPSDHLSGYGCPKCGVEKIGNAFRSNLKEFVEKAKIVHKDKYTYDKFVYKGSKIKGTITCEKHGDFEQSPTNHLRGKGCPKCGGGIKSNLEEFVEKANKIHNNFYDYSQLNYIRSYIKIKIICPIHGVFEQTPAMHLSGQGCPKCAGTYKSNLEEFVEKAKLIHKDSLYEYTYDRFVYVNARIKGIITCEKHGDFEQIPASHLSGHGCPECAKERQRELNGIKWTDRYDEGILYLIECWNDVERFVKIGVTSKTVEERYRRFGSMPYNYSILKEIQMDSNIVSDTEQYIINFYESYKPKITFGGDTECLSIDEKYQIVEFLENLEKDLNVYNSFNY